MQYNGNPIYAKFIDAGKEWNFFYGTDDTLYATGLNDHRQLAVESTENQLNAFTPVPAARYGNHELKFISAGNASTAVVTSTDVIYAVGYNVNGELGLGYSGADVTSLQQTPTSFTFYAKSEDTIDNGSVYSIAQTLSNRLALSGYTFKLYSDSAYTTENFLTDLVGSTNRVIYVKYERDYTP